MRGRQRIVELGGGSNAPSCVQALVVLPEAMLREGLRRSGPKKQPALEYHRKRTAAYPSLVGQAEHLWQVRLAPMDDRAAATSPRDKWRLLMTFASTMRWWSA